MANKQGSQESKKGKPSNAGKRKGKFDTFFSRAEQKKARRLKKYNSPVEVAKRERRRLAREARAQQKLEAARARHEAVRVALAAVELEAARVALAAVELEAAKKAKRSAAAKKAAATRAAKKAAKLATEVVNELVASA